MRIAILGFVLLLAGAARTWAAVYFVDYVGGSDVNMGTDPGRPWKHCPGDPAAGGVAAAVALVPGDTVRFRGGVAYVLTAATGIRLDWDGVEGARVTYDGNSDGSWGAGRAILTDQHGAGAVTAFSTSSARHHLTFTSFEFHALGGAAALPPDTGSPLPARFGGGIAFPAGADAIVIEECAFRELGYWQNQRPLAAESLAGAGITAAGRVKLTISRCSFSRMAKGCDFFGTRDFSQVKLDRCAFGEALVWPLDLPPDFGAASVLTLDVAATTIPGSSAFHGSGWTGYGAGPLTTELSVAFGETVVFSASALASPAASFQWFKDGVFLSGAFGSRLDLGTAEASDGGTYSVVATNAMGSATSNSIVLVVTGAPSSPPPSSPPASSLPPSDGGSSGGGSGGGSSGGGSSGGGTPPPAEIAVVPVIIQQPLAQSVTTGSSVSFTVTATGTPAPSYQWEKNGVPIAGATTATLTFSAVTQNDAANYRVVVSNIAGAVTSIAATLTVTEPAPVAVAPVITQQPVSMTVIAGTTAAFGVGATGTPAPSYQWERNGVPIAGATSAVLVLRGVSSNDAGTYRVLVSNTGGSVMSAPAALTVTEPAPVAVAPVITQQPVSLTAVAGTTAIFSVGATGTPAPSYQWQKNGVPIDGATTATLTLPGVSSNDAGTYRVLVSNTGGSVMSAPAALTVTEPAPVAVAPVITQQPVSLSVDLGDSATISVSATGTPAPSYQWEKNGVPIPGATAAVLTLQAVTLDDAADYRVVVRNTAGFVTSSSATLTIVEPPPPPTSAPPPPLVFATYTVRHAYHWVAAAFTVPGDSARRVLIRALGPTYATLDGAGAIADPKLDLYLSTGGAALTNDNWGGSPELAQASAQVGAAPFVSPGSTDSALVATLPPGQHIVVVSGVNGSVGNVLLEVYLLP